MKWTLELCLLSGAAAFAPPACPPTLHHTLDASAPLVAPVPCPVVDKATVVRWVPRRSKGRDIAEKSGRARIFPPLPIFALLASAFKKRYVLGVLAYYGLGVIVYQRLEGWSVINCMYFMTVTATTVGYGDHTPLTACGKLFSVLYSVLGFTVVMAAIAPLLFFMQGKWRENLLESIPIVRRAFSRKVDTSDMSLSIQEINKQINYPRRYALCLVGPLIVFGLVGLIARTVEGFGLIDSAYFSLITMSTIGYGDLSPTSNLGNILAIFYLPLAVVALADAISGIAAITTRRKIRRRDYAAVADELLLRNCVRNGRNPDFSLREGEFLVAVLLANDILDSDTLNAIRRQFRNMVRNATLSDSERVSVPPLTPKLVFAELVERGSVPAGMAFATWYKEQWTPRVQAAPQLPFGSPIDVPNFPDV